MASGLLGNGSTPTHVDVSAMFDSGVPGLVSELVKMGNLVSIGTTRDRGALTLTITNNGDWDREYFRRSDDAEDWLRHAIDVLGRRDGGVEATQPPPVQARRRARSRLA